MKITSNKNKQLYLIRRFLYGLMSEVEEISFFEKIRTDEKFRRLAAAEVILCKNYAIEQRRNQQFVQELKKIDAGCFPFSQQGDDKIESDIQ